jgi:hypothetical protein
MIRITRLLSACLVLLSAASTWAQPAPASSRLGINLAAPADWNTELPFVDVFRLSREWISQKRGAPWGQGPALALDGNGWVQRLEPDSWAESLVLTIEGGHYPTGEYVVLYDGAGRLEFTGTRRVVSRAPGRIVVEPNPSGGFTIQIRETDPANHLRNVRVLMPGSERSYRENPWNPGFLERWRSVNTIRFMDWMHTNDSQAAEWTGRPTPDSATFAAKGVPVELMVELANRLGANPWFCMPHTASDDYVRAFAELVRKTLRSDLVPYIEYSNEIWNFGFPQTQYAADRGVAAGLASQPWEAAWRYASRRSVEIFRIWESVYGGSGRFLRVMASQAANAYIAEVKLTFEEAYRHVDALAIAPYFTLNVGPDTEPSAAAVAEWTVPRVIEYLGSTAIPEAEEWVRANREVAQRFRLRLIAYEGGQHVVAIGGAANDARLTGLLAAANRHPDMGALYTRYLDSWKSAGGGDLFCLFASVEPWTRWGSWGLLEYADDDTSKYRAVTAWNRANPR